MKSSVVLGALTLIGSLALSAMVAQAGGTGGIPSPLVAFFICQSINGDDAGLTVDVESSALLTDPKGVRIGNATLACGLAKLRDSVTGALLLPNPDQLGKQSLKCYSISVARKTNSPNRVNMTDQLTGQEQVQMTGVQYICAAADFNP